jgi:O-acetyl-ADP-ribose deacetylase (regulator of RNase III)
MWRKKSYNNPRRQALAALAKETKATTPTIASRLPHLDPAKSEKLELQTLPALDSSRCPRFQLANQSGPTHGTPLRVFNQDSFDAAIAMPASVLGVSPSGKAATTVETEILGLLRSGAGSPQHLRLPAAARVAVLNMASATNPGGGWLGGAAAQEESLCFRSTLAASLHRTMYPIQPTAGLHTRDVVVFRESMANGHKFMMPETPAPNLPVVSALTVAGIRRPEVKPEVKPEVGPGAAPEAEPEAGPADGASGSADQRAKAPKGPLVFADPAARDLTKDKMRLCLRMAGARGHTMLVLGAIGCGAFRNPPQEIVKCWQEVLGEREFAGGWFREIWFAVYDRRNEGNFEIFSEVFDGKSVGGL